MSDYSAERLRLIVTARNGREKSKALRADPDLPVDEIYKTLGISRVTFYRYTTGIQAKEESR